MSKNIVDRESTQDSLPGVLGPGDVAHCETLYEVMAARAHALATREAFAFLADEGSRSTLGYDELLRGATEIGTALQRKGSAGDRVLLVYPPGLQFITALFGCWAAGMIAIPAYPPRTTNDRARQRLLGIMENAEPGQILTVAKLIETVGSMPGADRIRSIATDNLGDDRIGIKDPVRPAAADVALLQYTSGTTASPKGVAITHANLLHNSALICESFGHSPGSHGVIWLPPYHDMGLIGGILQPVYAGFPVTLMAPTYFLQRPLRWLQAISGRRAVTSGGPNFAYDLCVRTIRREERDRLDLSGWEIAFSGGEPIDPEVLERFADAFGTSGFRREAFYPCYGLAESTLMVSGAEKGRRALLAVAPRRAPAERAASGQTGPRVISCGRARGGGKILVVDPVTRTLRPEGVVGEIWIASPSVANGYWGESEATGQMFGATLSDTRQGPFLRSGDLGFVQGGELYVTGRLKDLIIIRGVNHYPTDLERTVGSCHPAVRPGCGVAFSVVDDGLERLVIVQEIERSQRRADMQSVTAAIRQAVSATHDLQVFTVLLLRPGQVLKTSSGKVQRLDMKAAFLAGKLDPLHEWRLSLQPDASVMPPPEDASSIIAFEGWIASRLAAAVGTGVEVIDVHEPFARYGLDSMQAVVMAGEIAQHLGREVSAALFWDYPTVSELARQLAKQADAAGSH